MTHLSMGDALLMVPGKDEAKNTNSDQSHGSHDPDHLPVEGPTKVSQSDPRATQLNNSQRSRRRQKSHRCTSVLPASTERLSVSVLARLCWLGRDLAL